NFEPIVCIDCEHKFKPEVILKSKMAPLELMPEEKTEDTEEELLKEVALRPDRMNRLGNKKGEQKPLRFGEFKTKLKEILHEAGSLNLSRTEPALKPLSKEEAARKRAERSKAEKIKKLVFKPIQSEIIKNHGEHAATLILGNRIIAALIAGETEQLKNYQLKLIVDYGRQLEIDLSPFMQKPTNA
ncbi:MAG: hypothetical protein L3J31_09320, partial [Bacteroidales bacterium]|nr:hypothetical protein [Bacteroidales bacterium]